MNTPHEYAIEYWNANKGHLKFGGTLCRNWDKQKWVIPFGIKGIYILIVNGEVIYVGESHGDTICIRTRWGCCVRSLRDPSHKHDMYGKKFKSLGLLDAEIEAWYIEADVLDIDSKLRSYLAESLIIEALKPKVYSIR